MEPYIGQDAFLIHRFLDKTVFLELFQRHVGARLRHTGQVDQIGDTESSFMKEEGQKFFLPSTEGRCERFYSRLMLLLFLLRGSKAYRYDGSALEIILDRDGAVGKIEVILDDGQPGANTPNLVFHGFYSRSESR